MTVIRFENWNIFFYSLYIGHYFRCPCLKTLPVCQGPRGIQGPIGPRGEKGDKVSCKDLLRNVSVFFTDTSVAYFHKQEFLTNTE